MRLAVSAAVEPPAPASGRSGEQGGGRSHFEGGEMVDVMMVAATAIGALGVWALMFFG